MNEHVCTYVSVRPDKRLFAVQHALERGYSVDAINRISNIDRWFLHRLKVIADMKAQTTSLGALDKLSVAHLRSLKIRGFSDRCVGLALPPSTSLLSRHPLRTLPLLSSPSRSPQAGGSLLRVHGAGGAAAQDTAERAALLQPDRHVGR